MDQKQKITGVILAGGQARRMEGQDKGLVQLGDKPLIEWTIDSLSPQVGSIMINANRNFEIYHRYKLRIIADYYDDFCGPLAGMASAMIKIKTPLMATVPCDSPFIPDDLIVRLYQSLEKNNADIAVAHNGERIQPVFTLMKTTLSSSIRTFLESGGRKIDKWFEEHKLAITDFSDKPDMFLNINTPEDLEMIEARLKIPPAPDSHDIPIVGFAAYSGTGKTTLLKKLIGLFSQNNINVGVIKHAHHEFDIDHPGKDSYELRKAGAKQILVGSKNRWAHIVEYSGEHTYTLEDHINHMAGENLDLILVEGFKPEAIPKIEIIRSGFKNPLFYPSDSSVIAIATDGELPQETDLPVLDLNSAEEIYEFICKRFLSISNELKFG